MDDRRRHLRFSVKPTGSTSTMTSFDDRIIGIVDRSYGGMQYETATTPPSIGESMKLSLLGGLSIVVLVRHVRPATTPGHSFVGVEFEDPRLVGALLDWDGVTPTPKPGR
jgi:hypothetical protein